MPAKAVWIINFSSVHLFFGLRAIWAFVETFIRNLKPNLFWVLHCIPIWALSTCQSTKMWIPQSVIPTHTITSSHSSSASSYPLPKHSIMKFLALVKHASPQVGANAVWNYNKEKSCNYPECLLFAGKTSPKGKLLENALTEHPWSQSVSSWSSLTVNDSSNLEMFALNCQVFSPFF